MYLHSYNLENPSKISLAFMRLRYIWQIESRIHAGVGYALKSVATFLCLSSMPCPLSHPPLPPLPLLREPYRSNLFRHGVSTRWAKISRCSVPYKHLMPTMLEFSLKDTDEPLTDRKLSGAISN